MRSTVLITMALFSSIAYGNKLSEQQIDAAIKAGKNCKGVSKLLEKIDQRQSVKVDGYWTKSGSKYIAIISPLDQVEIAACRSHVKLTKFDREEAQKLLTENGLYLAQLRIRVVGSNNQSIIKKKFQDVSLAIKTSNEEIIHPAEEEQPLYTQFLGPELYQIQRAGNITAVNDVGSAFSSGEVRRSFLFKPLDGAFKFIIMADDGKKIESKEGEWFEVQKWRKN